MSLDQINKNDKYVIRQLHLGDCDGVRQIWQTIVTAVQRDANEIMLKVDPKGTFVAMEKETGKVIGVCSGIILSDELGHMGQFAVLPDYRGLGVGSALWDAAMAHIGNQRNVSLFSSPKMVNRYKTNGFPIEHSVKMVFHMGFVDYTNMKSTIEGISIINLSEDNIEKVIQYDRQICGFDRKPFIEGLLGSAVAVTAVALNPSEKVIGYCVVCQTENKYKNKGPPVARTDQNYADSPLIGEVMLAHCMREMTARSFTKLVFRCYETNKHFLDLAQRLGLDYFMTEPLLFSKGLYNFNLNKINSPSLATFFPC